MTNEQIVARLENAGRTLLCLPPESLPGRMRATTWDYVSHGVRAFHSSLARPLRITPAPGAIDRMDEALTWLGLIPADRFIMRRIVAARCMVSPLTDRHLFPWRRIGSLLGADHKAVQRWHADGINAIRNGMPAAIRRAA